jgi:circadian clock protein KaiC
MTQQPTAASGIEGLDDILRGGFPAGRILLIEGDPGVGKTTLALQFLIEGAKRGEASVYVTLSETREELLQVAASHGWSLDGIDIFELATPAAFSEEGQNTLFHPSEVELAEMTKSVADLCTRVNPRRLVFDSLSEIRLLAQSPLRYRREVLAFKQFFAGRNTTVLLLDDRTDAGNDGHLQSIAHGVVSLEQLIPLYGSHRRRLRITKLRGVDFRGGYHDFVIREGGLDVFPRLIASEHGEPGQDGAASSGVDALDTMLGGGIDRGTSALFLGPPGTGKSALATQWALAAAKRGERAAIYAFDESIATLERRSLSLGMDLPAQVKAGNVVLRQIDPAELPPGQLTRQIRDAVEREGIRLVVIDSINGYLNAMPQESFLVLQLHELLAYLGRKGVVLILVVAQHGLVGGDLASPVDVTYLADTVLLLRHFEAAGALHRAISVMKKRTGGHEASIRELHFGHGGVSAGEPLQRFNGVLTGVPTFEGTAAELADLGGRRGGAARRD